MSDGPPYGEPPTPGQEPGYQPPNYGQGGYGQGGYGQQYEPQPFNAANPYGQTPYQQRYQWPEQSNAVTALVVSLIGLIVCSGLISPIGWYIGHQEVKAIDAGRRDPSNRGMAQAGKIVGIVGSVILVLIIGLFAIAILAAVLSAPTA